MGGGWLEALGVGWGGCPPPCLALSFPARGTEKLYYLTSMGPPSGLNLRFITIWGNKVILADRTHSDLPAPGGVVPSSFPHLTPQSQLALRQVRAPGGGGGGGGSLAAVSRMGRCGEAGFQTSEAASHARPPPHQPSGSGFSALSQLGHSADESCQLE